MAKKGENVTLSLHPLRSIMKAEEIPKETLFIRVTILSMNKRCSSCSSTSSSWGLWMRAVVRKLQTTVTRVKGVKQGHFVVIATQGWKPERFFVELGYLDHPDFLKLLKQAEEEFGFSQVGALEIPCQPDDIKRIVNGSKKNREH
ncbi:hypothetical protein Fmac_006362 [Flemingia macrophylla]|uniref:Uncharacterized protein n=1 Tax=Flemingia macrophylla TaxID=520843 RepID=A0ABD1NBJ8_9FABA